MGALEFFQVMAWERRCKRLRKRLKRLAEQEHELHHQLSENQDMQEALANRLGDLEHKIEFSGVYDD